MKFFIFAVLIIVAPIIAGCYGALHNQLSYTICPEFFTKFRFLQFNISEDMPPRLGAAIVGWKNTWWLGVTVGAVLALVGFIQKDYKKMFFSTIQAFLLCILVAFSMGLLGLLFGLFFMGEKEAGWHLPEGLQHSKDFMVVSTMHNFSKMGGIAGMFLGIYWHMITKRKDGGLTKSTAEFI